jgi:hypothetical protein
MLLDTLMPNLMPDGTEGGGAAGGEGTEQAGTAGTEGGERQSATDGQQGQTGGATERQPSANKLIKDFAAERGISVEELLTSYQQLEDAGKTELERLTGQVNDFKSKYEQAMTELQTTRSEAAFLEAAREARARAPKTLFRAVRDQLEYDNAGRPTNIAEVIAAARDDEPDLFQPATGASDAGRRGDGAGDAKDINAVLREMAGRH